MISIILGTYNRIARLRQCLESIHQAGLQLSSPPEIIILDGGSIDGTNEYLKSKPFNLDIKIINEGKLHGVTRAYNRGFRLASKEFITWTSDDCLYLPQSLSSGVSRLRRESANTLVSFLMDAGEGQGFIDYGENSPIAAGHKSLFKKVDFWSEDFITYASDNDFCIKIHKTLGGKVVSEPNAKVIHQLDMKDDLHIKNIALNKCSARYGRLYSKSWELVKKPKRIYPDIWIHATNAAELINKIESAKLTYSWGNFYTALDFGIKELLLSMNVSIEPFKNNDDYNIIL